MRRRVSNETIPLLHFSTSLPRLLVSLYNVRFTAKGRAG